MTSLPKDPITRRYFTDEQLRDLATEIKTIPVDGEGRALVVEYNEHFVRGTVLKLIADLHSTQEEISKLKHKWISTDTARALMDDIADKNEKNSALEARALQAEQELKEALEGLKRAESSIGAMVFAAEHGMDHVTIQGALNTIKDVRSIISKLEQPKPEPPDKHIYEDIYDQ